VLERFPDSTAKIRRLFLADQSFRSACEDYLLAVESLKKMNSLPGPSKGMEIYDYTSLIEALECEILTYIASSARSG
jgi:hypothetical protein